MFSFCSARSLVLAASGLALGLLAVGCSSSSQAPAPSPADTEPEPSKPALSLLYVDEESGLVLQETQAGTPRKIDPAAQSTGSRAVSPSGQYVAFTYTTPDSSHLAILDLSELSVQSVDVRPESATYSLQWHARDSRLAFAYYLPAESGTRGPGDVFVADPDGSTRDVGCSAAREVLDWLPNGTLATRNDERLYVVSASNCATEASADARRMHLASYAPSGDELAYIHRELAYNREEREYVPDSSLYLSDQNGGNSTELFGDDRRVRHVRWAPDASELAFDVWVEDSEHRQIAVFNLDTERTVYLTAPSQTRADQVRPRWSPSGNYVAFTARTSSGAQATVRVGGQTRRLGPVDGAVWGWLDERTVVVPGPDTLRLNTLRGETRYKEPAPASLVHVWTRNPV